MIRPGHIQLKLREGVETRAPAHLDVLAGARNVDASVDGNGAVDCALHGLTHAMQVRRVFHASQNLKAVGARDRDYSSHEENHGLSRILKIEVSDHHCTHDAITALCCMDAVEWARVETLSTVPPISRSLGEPANDAAFARVHWHAARAVEPGDENIRVAVIDTGVDLDHTEFTGRLTEGYDTVDLGYGPVAEGISLVGDSQGRDAEARDETGHGTHVAGIIGARGLSMPAGVAGQARVIPIRALAAARAGDGPVFGVGGLSDIDAAIKAAVDLGAKVINMSFGTAAEDVDAGVPPPHTDAIAYATAHGVIPVAAMGNSGLEENYYPAALEQVIAVGSMSLAGSVSPFSTRGVHIALCAPGEEVHSTKLHGYGASTGTSHAAPFVAGACALLAAKARRAGREIDTDTARKALCYSADPLGRAPGEDAGWGMLDIPAALLELDQFMPVKEELSP